MKPTDALYERGQREIAKARRSLADVRLLVNEIADDLEIVLGDAPALAIPIAANRKLAPVDMVDVGMPRKRPVPRRPFCSSTYMPVTQTCPSTCPFRGNGCMAESGYTGRAVKRLEELAAGLSPRRLAKAEARAIDRLCSSGVPRDGGRTGLEPRDLRLHVSGDVTTRDGLELLARAVERWKQRGGGSAWTFTHAWRSLAREGWGPISVLASVETPVEADTARRCGYVPALTVRSFPSRTAFRVAGSSTTWIPCPAETSRRTCVECRLCLDHEPWLRSTGRGIAFAVHGPQDGAAKRVLPVLVTHT